MFDSNSNGECCSICKQSYSSDLLREIWYVSHLESSKTELSQRGTEFISKTETDYWDFKRHSFVACRSCLERNIQRRLFSYVSIGVSIMLVGIILLYLGFGVISSESKTLRPASVVTGAVFQVLGFTCVGIGIHRRKKESWDTISCEPFGWDKSWRDSERQYCDRYMYELVFEDDIKSRSLPAMMDLEIGDGYSGNQE